MTKAILALRLITISHQGVLFIIERPELEVKASYGLVVRTQRHSRSNMRKTCSNNVERRA